MYNLQKKKDRKFEGGWPYLRMPFIIVFLLVVVAHVVSFLVLVEPWINPWDKISIGIILWGLTPFLVLGFAITYFFNRYPTIWLNTEGLAISFNCKKLFLSWDNIILVKRKEFSFADDRIYARKITLFHYIYGIGYNDLLPAIYIDPTLDAELKEELFEAIAQHLERPV